MKNHIHNDFNHENDRETSPMTIKKAKKMGLRHFNKIKKFIIDRIRKNEPE